jgi:hypothetical protein
MADWRQIQARIRKAKGSTNPSAKLSELYQRTRDAMVAFELAVLEEKDGRLDEAAKWYVAAAGRFRRAEWKKKAEEALARLGVEVPASAPERESESDTAVEAELPHLEADQASETPRAFAEIPADSESAAAEGNAESQPEPGSNARPESRGRRRRGRRGGRGRRRKSPAANQAPAQAASAAPAAREATDNRVPAETTESSSRVPAHAEFAPPQLPSERSARGRAGDPGLASRMAYLESMLRRLLSSPLHRLDELGDAPAGPGVFLLSDSDQVTSYYVESCQTLRIGLGNLARGGHGRGSRGGDRSYPGIDLKEKLAEHLGVNQSKVTQYIKDHCIVRWLQLDEEAPHLAHFAIGVLRTPLNLD